MHKELGHKESDEDEDDDLYEVQEISVDAGQEAIRIDKYLSSKLSNISRNRIQNNITSGSILVNGKEIKSNYQIRPNDVIQVVIVKPFNEDSPITGEDIPIDIVYEDGHLLVVNKPSGMVVHPGKGNWTGTLVNALVHYLDKSNLPLLPGNRQNRPGLVHRIDKHTSGLLVIAKTDEAMDGLAKQFFDHSINRHYRALIWGDLEEESGTINAPITRHPKNRLQQLTLDPKSALNEEIQFAKNAITHYKVIEELYYVTLVDCWLETGRTHQIRSHFKFLHKPLFGDTRYGGNHILKGTVFSKYKSFVENTMELLDGQALHAYSLGFKHPVTKEEMYFEAPLPDSLSKVLERWRNYVDSRKENI